MIRGVRGHQPRSRRSATVRATDGGEFHLDAIVDSGFTSYIQRCGKSTVSALGLMPRNPAGGSDMETVQRAPTRIRPRSSGEAFGEA